MNSKKNVILILGLCGKRIGIIPLSGSNKSTEKMTQAESEQIENEVKRFFDKATEYSERGQGDLFFSTYDNSPDFLHIGPDGKMTDYEEYKKSCTEYYNVLKEQKITTIRENINVLDADLVIFSWTGNIVAQFKNGDIMILNNYSITSVVRKNRNHWKVIQSHESSLPPEIIKKE